MNQKMMCMILVFLWTGPGDEGGYSSSYWVVTGMSLTTGKVLDVEVMSKECWECIDSISKKVSGI